MSKQLNDKEELKNQLEKYINNKKWFLISILCCLLMAFIYLRYATDSYKIAATINGNKIPKNGY